jgi:hypothetical protein
VFNVPREALEQRCNTAHCPVVSRDKTCSSPLDHFYFLCVLLRDKIQNHTRILVPYNWHVMALQHLHGQVLMFRRREAVMVFAFFALFVFRDVQVRLITSTLSF